MDIRKLNIGDTFQQTGPTGETVTMQITEKVVLDDGGLIISAVEVTA